MDWNARIHAAFEKSPHAPDQDVREELAEHARAVYDGARADGCSEDEAERRVHALIAKWVADAPRLRHRRRRAPAIAPPPDESVSPLSGIVQDVRYAGRILRRQSRFAALVILTLALGIGSTTALFSVTYGVLLKPLPWPSGDRLVVLKETRGGLAPRFGSFSNAAYMAWREKPQLVDELGAWTLRTATLAEPGGAAPERIRAASVTSSLFRAIGARPIAGALFDDNDESSPVIVLSEGLWRRRFGGDSYIVGKPVLIDGESRTIVGVIPDEIGYPDRLVRAWVPFNVPPPTGNLLSMFEAVALLRPGVTPEQAAAEGTARGRFAASTGMTTTAIFGGDGAVEVRASPLAEAMTGSVRQPLIVLLTAIALLLLIATANVAGLQLSRAVSRRRELAIRAAIGASGPRLIRQLLVENLVLGLIGGLGGIGLAWALQRSAPSILPADFPRVTDLATDLPVVLFALGIALATSVGSGALIAIRLRRLNLVSSLAEDGTSPAGSGRSGLARTRLIIVTGQTAIACLLLVGALLLGRSFYALLNADRGYDPRPVLSARVILPSPAYTPARRSEVLSNIIGNLSRIPGVRATAFTTELPLTPGGSTSGFTLPSPNSATGTIQVQASPRIVSPAYFTTLDLRILAGRSLAESDSAASEPVVVVNETFRRRYLQDQALGAKLPRALWGQNQEGDATVVGVVEDVRYIGAATTSLAELYFSYRQLQGGVRPTMAALLIRADGAPDRLAGAVRRAVADIDAAIVPDNIMTLEERLLAGSLARPRLYAILLVSFAVIALLVTGVGLFSVLSFTVAQRTRELGVRAALGATRGELVGLVLRQGVGVAAAGGAVGLIASVWAVRYLASLLYGITTGDALTYIAVPVVLLFVIVVACIAPARRASKLDPVKALRS